MLHFLPIAPTCANSDALLHDGRQLCFDVAPPSTTREKYEATVRRMRQTILHDAVETARLGEDALREMPCAADIWTFLGDAYNRVERLTRVTRGRARACVLSGEDDKLSAPRLPEKAFGYSPLGATMSRLATCVAEPPAPSSPQ